MPGGYHHRGGTEPPFGDLYDDAGKHHPNTDPLYGRVREGLDEWGVPIPPDTSGDGGRDKTTTKRDRQGRRGRRRGVGKRRARSTPKAVRTHPQAGAGNAGKGSNQATVAYPHASQATGGAMPLLELDALSEAGLSVTLAELVGHGRVTLARTLSAFQREQDRITNRTWRRPGGLARPAGL